MVNPFSGSGIMQTVLLSRWELCFMGHYSKCVICSVLLCGYWLVMIMQISFYYLLKNLLCAGNGASCGRTGTRWEDPSACPSLRCWVLGRCSLTVACSGSRFGSICCVLKCDLLSYFPHERSLLAYFWCAKKASIRYLRDGWGQGG